ncbi:non-ribosomal peptide synthetase, partial [Shewanella sp.]|uniref:non-ribosomal peptide synthetase n=1 Tax=Shewanella sp. TaxID=50422 RepID=UPI004054270E
MEKMNSTKKSSVSTTDRKALLQAMLVRKGISKQKDKVSIAKRPVHSPVPSSFSQQRLWTTDQIQNGSPEYNMQAAFDISGTLNLSILSDVFTTVLQRNEVLRTVYQEDEGEVRQHVIAISDIAFQINQVNLYHLDEELQQAEVLKLLEEDASSVFDLANDLMLRVHYLELGKNSGMLIVNIHHIAADGWSLEVLSNEFTSLYNAYVQGQKNPLPELPIQYADYAYWQREHLSSEHLQTQANYWKGLLEDIPAVHSLPLCKPRDLQVKGKGSSLIGGLSAATAEKLLKLAQSQQMTPFMLSHSALVILLSRYSNSHDIVIGTPIANRKQSELKNLIGFFVNTLVLRANTKHNNVNDFFSHIRQLNLDAQANSDLSFDSLVDLLNTPRELAHAPLFQIMLTTESDFGLSDASSKGEIRLPEVCITPRSLPTSLAKFDLHIDIKLNDQGAQLEWVFNTSLFSIEFIQQLNGHFELLLTSLSKMEEVQTQPLSSLKMLSDSDVKSALSQATAEKSAFDGTLCTHVLFEQIAEQTPDKPAITFDGLTLSYKELNLRANQLAHYLKESLKVKPEQRIVVMTDCSFEMIIGILAVLKAGAAYVPVDPAYPAQRITQLLVDAEPIAMLSMGCEASKLEHVKCPIIELHGLGSSEKNEHLCASYSKSNLHPETTGVLSSNLAYVIYTSGSTGKPKGVMVEHQSLVGSTKVRNASYEQVNGFLLLSSYAFDSSVAGIFHTLTSGGNLCIPTEQEKHDIAALTSLVKHNKVSHMLCIPSLYRAFLEYWSEKESFALKEVIIAGESCPVSLVQRHEEFFGRTQVKLVNEYGPTEATVWCTHQVPEHGKPITIGKPITNTQVFILDSNAQLVPDGTVGEIHIGGAFLARGYLNLPELTLEK